MIPLLKLNYTNFDAGDIEEMNDVADAMYKDTLLCKAFKRVDGSKKLFEETKRFKKLVKASVSLAKTLNAVISVILSDSTCEAEIRIEACDFVLSSIDPDTLKTIGEYSDDFIDLEVSPVIGGNARHKYQTALSISMCSYIDKEFIDLVRQMPAEKR